MSTLLLLLCISASVETTSAQTATSQYWTSVNPATSSSVIYGNIEKNWTIPFQAVWSYGTDSGKAVENATLTLEVKTDAGESVESISQTTNSTGFAIFYYVSSSPAVLTFTPTSLVMQDETEYNASLFGNGQSAVYGMKSESVTVYWDTFDVSLVSTNTDSQGVTAVSVNVTYLMVPEEGLVIPNSSPEQVFPKIANGVNVTINGVKAEETSVPGVYTANFSTWLPTTYVLVEVTQENWIPAQKGFSFYHNFNASFWTPAAVIVLVLVAAVVLYRLFKKKEGTALLYSTGFPFIGGVLLALTSFISLYWGIVGFDSTISGFDWAWLAASELLAFGFGLAGSIISMIKRKQAIVIFAICIPMLTNVIAIKAALDAYQLATPWLIIVPSFILSVLSGILISNADKNFKN